MRSPVFLTALAAALALAGCGAAQSSSAEDFQGQEKAVADVIEELQSAGSTGDEAKVCDELISPELAKRFAAGDSDCHEEVSKALSDADDQELRVTDVSISGDTATAQVRAGDDSKTTATFELQRRRGRWFISSIAPS
jgi:hypothetical protein